MNKRTGKWGIEDHLDYCAAKLDEDDLYYTHLMKVILSNWLDGGKIDPLRYGELHHEYDLQ